MIMRTVMCLGEKMAKGGCIVSCHRFGYILFPLLADHQQCRTKRNIPLL